jgi:predicted ATP-grasp superfamily ATP-dependent carboligase
MDVRRVNGSARRTLRTPRAEEREESPLIWVTERPKLNRPVLICSFEGWNDAGEAASLANAYLAKTWDAAPFAEIDPEEFFDFTEVRPEVRHGPHGQRRIVWPSTTLSVAIDPAGGQDVVLMSGFEPHLKWRTFCRTVLELARELEAERVVTLGAYLAEVTHHREVPVNVVLSEDRDRTQRRSLYEGPTGIVGVLQAALTEADFPSASMWASVPCYSSPVSAKAALALVQAIGELVNRTVDTEELAEASVEYEQRMDELVAEDEHVAAYVARIKEMEDAVGGDLSAEGLAEEIERFLQDRN